MISLHRLGHKLEPFRLNPDLIVTVEATPDTVLTLATGIGGLPELSLQVAPAQRGTGLGTALARAARGLVPAGEPVAACVSPANVPSLRALLSAGFEPVGSVQVYREADGTGD